MFLFFLSARDRVRLVEHRAAQRVQRGVSRCSRPLAPSTRFIGDLNNFTSDFRAAEGRHLLSSTATESAGSKKEIADLAQAVVQAQDGYEGLRHSPEISSQYAQFKQK